jgi:hypothetical protein
MSEVREGGFTMLELLVGTVIALVVAAGAAAAVGLFARASVAQPFLADEQQRARAAFDQLTTIIGRAGAGLGGTGANAGVLLVPALYPHRRGVAGADPGNGAYDDRITVLSEDETRATAGLAAPMASAAAPLWLDLATCAPGRPACGFSAGGRVLVADDRAVGEWFSGTPVAPDRMDHVPAALSNAYVRPARTVLARVDPVAFAFDAPRRQLRLVRHGSDLPWMDDVEEFSVSWLGDVRPPRRPAPAPGEESCLVDVLGAPRLPGLEADHGPWVRLSATALSDGPWCGEAPWQFDADLFRVRVVRVRLRWRRGGGAAGAAAGDALEFDIAPVNLVRGG